MAEFEKHYRKITDWHAKVFGISVDTVEENKKLKSDLSLSFEIISDKNRKVIKDWHILNTRERGGIAYPNLYILNSQREIIFHSSDRLASRADISIMLDFMIEYSKNPEHRFFNTTRKMQSITFKDFIMAFPRRFFG